jgi:protein-S-isoprenylcysteine O-methyltransferase Ste14
MGSITTRKKDITPLIMWFVLFAGIMVLAVVRLHRFSGDWYATPAILDVAFIGLYLFWMIIEFRITAKDVSTEGKKTADAMTCQLYGVGQAGTILTALWLSPVWRGPDAANFAGIGVFFLGASYRLWAIFTLGRFYSHRVRTVSDHRIVASGPYRVARHPAYAGMIIANAGISAYFFNWVTLCVYLFILVPAIILRIFVEEKTLFGIEGYPEFARKRKRLFPGVW